MKEYFRLQFLRFHRTLFENGTHPLLGYPLIIVGFFLISEYIFQKTDFANYILMLVNVSWLIKLSDRSRTDFITSTFGDFSKYKIRFFENLIASSLFILFFIYKGLCWEALGLVVLSIIAGVFQWKTQFNFPIPTPFSKTPFEFSVGFRKSLPMIVSSYLLTYIAISVDNLNLGLFTLLLIFLISLSYYAKPEPDYYVWIYAQKPQIFLQNKILTAIKNSSLLICPILISLFIFYPSKYEWILIILGSGYLFLTTMVIIKYTAFPNEIGLSETVPLVLSLSLPLLLLIFIPYFYFKSIKNLKLLK